MPSHGPLNVALRRRKTIWVFKWLLTTIFLITLLWQGLLVYNRERQRDWVKRARAAFERGDYDTASIWLTRLFQTNKANVEACRFMADIADSRNSPEAMLWRIRAVQLEPTNPENFLAWAKTALRLRDLGVAARALKLMPERGCNSAAFHSLSAALAMNSSKSALAEFHFAEAARLEPGNPVHAANRATVRLQASDPDIAAKARADLEQLATNSGLQLLAWRALAKDALERNDIPHALEFAHKLTIHPRAEFGDRLTMLEALWKSQNPEFQGALRQRQEESAQRAESIPSLTYLMINHDMAREAIAWLRQLPEKTRSIPLVTIAQADALMSLKDWSGLRDLLTNFDWERLEFMRRAMLARALRETAPQAYADSWNDLENSVRDKPGEALMLGQLVAHWGWNSEAASLFWHVANSNTGLRGPALEDLNQVYQLTGDTIGLRRVAEDQLHDNPDDVAAKHNFALLSLLLRLNLPQAQATLEALYHQNPSNPTITSSYALGLHIQGKDADAVAALEKLPPEQLRQSGIALYYGIVLAATHQREKAQTFFDLARGAPLLPEEKALLAEAKRAN